MRSPTASAKSSSVRLGTSETIRRGGERRADSAGPIRLRGAPSRPAATVASLAAGRTAVLAQHAVELGLLGWRDLLAAGGVRVAGLRRRFLQDARAGDAARRCGRLRTPRADPPQEHEH